MTFKQVKEIVVVLVIILVAELLIVQGLTLDNQKPAPTPTVATVPTPQSSSPLTRFLGRNPSPVQRASASAAVKPKALQIPKINISTVIEPVGLDKNKAMEVPKDPRHVGWYTLGAKPGTPGNAVVSGHVDAVFGPAIFYRLNTLNKGDKITVTDDNSKTFTYQVTKKQSYKTENFPLNDVFGPTNESRLNLITCSGTYDRKLKDYSNRLVVYATLVN